MTLLTDPWMPVRRRDGRGDWVSPLEISDPDIVAFNACRPDFNGALAQFVVGLLQTAVPVNTEAGWSQLFANPPSSATLSEWFSPFAAAFELDGRGARFMQDFSLGVDEGTENEVSALLIESPGENALKNNTDHFVKRGQVSVMCRDCVAAALLTLQINAPSGGAGHRTGLRGGGPLTTLILSEPPSSLWRDTWLNVQAPRYFLRDRGDPEKSALHYIFPWLADNSALQKSGGEVAPVQVHPAHVFWAMPRRIRVDFSAPSAGECDICHRASSSLVRRYLTKNYGLNYKGAWDHPLSPYYRVKEDWLPVHPQPGGIGYRHWLAWVCGLKSEKELQRARAVENFMQLRWRTNGQLRLWAFGYDMDNMKARCWYESALPLYGFVDCSAEAQRGIELDVALWLAGAELAALCLRGAVKDAWFSGEARGDFSAIDASFWSATEPAFYADLMRLIELRKSGADSAPLQLLEAWHRLLVRTATELFDGYFVGAGPVERQNPRRVAHAYQRLARTLRGPKMRKALGLSSSLSDNFSHAP